MFNYRKPLGSSVKGVDPILLSANPEQKDGEFTAQV